MHNKLIDSSTELRYYINNNNISREFGFPCGGNAMGEGGGNWDEKPSNGMAVTRWVAAAAIELRFDCCAGKNEKFSEISWQLCGLESA